MTAYRFMYRPPGKGYWTVLLCLTAYIHTKRAAELVAKWNWRDRGKLEWQAELVDPRDFDHPAQQKEYATCEAESS